MTDEQKVNEAALQVVRTQLERTMRDMDYEESPLAPTVDDDALETEIERLVAKALNALND